MTYDATSFRYSASYNGGQPWAVVVVDATPFADWPLRRLG
jgi:hypothetical protein